MIIQYQLINYQFDNPIQQQSMIIPQFKLSQTQNQIQITLRLPYVKISACEFSIQQHCFKFYLKPYLLSLSFEQPLQQAQQPAKATYNEDKYLLEVALNKKNKSEHFNNLNFISSLINNKKNNHQQPQNNKIQIVGSQGNILISDDNQLGLANNYSYGFCHNYSNVFTNLQEECSELFSFNPEQIPIQNRYELSKKITKQHFDYDAYLFDKYENQNEINEILTSKQFSKTIKKMQQQITSTSPQSYASFKNSLKIPNKQLLIKSGYQTNISKQLLSLSFSYLYQLKCMSGEFSVQSPKTINNTSAILNCCVDYANQTEQDILIDCSRRCLTYSLYKNIHICNQVISQLAKQFHLDFLCSILANLRVMFDQSNPRYLLNTIFVDDYLIYCFKTNNSEEFKKVRENVKNITITQQNLSLGISQQQEQEQQQQQQAQRQKNKQSAQKIIENH